MAVNCNDEGKRLSGKRLPAVLKKVRKPDAAIMAGKNSGCNILDGKDEGGFVRLKTDRPVAYSLVDGVHANGIASFRALLERGVYGIFHNVSVKYLQSYADGVCFRLNRRNNKETFEALVNLAVK